MNSKTIVPISLIVWRTILFAGPNLQASDAAITRETIALSQYVAGNSSTSSQLHVIDPEACTRCGACEAVCDYDAVSVR